MKILIVSLILAVAISAAYAETATFEDLSVYDYHRKFGIPQATKVREAEELAQSNNDQSRIVGGSVTDISQVPYQAGLLIRILFVLTSMCGGTIISSTRIVTAAHCYTDGILTAQSFTVILGSNTIFSGGVRIETTDFSVHPNWIPRLAYNDIAVLRIPSVSFTNVIQPIALPSGDQTINNFVGWTALASGWGLTSDGGSIPTTQIISSVNLPIITNQQCASVYGTDFVRDSNICTSGEGGRGTCQGDSGGPLAVTINGIRVLVGVTSFEARAGCELGFPAAYARITYYLFWLSMQ